MNTCQVHSLSYLEVAVGGLLGLALQEGERERVDVAVLWRGVQGLDLFFRQGDELQTCELVFNEVDS